MKLQKPKTPPAVLHRYRAPEEVSKGYLEDLLTKNRTWATSPARFNDPFDCRARFSFDGSRHDVKSFLTRQYAKHSGLTRVKQRREVKALIADRFWEKQDAREDLLAGFQVSIDNSAVLCLCESATNPLMWAHYALGHRGICLSFETSAPPFSKAVPVRYQMAYPSANFMADATEQMKAFILTKAKWWCYEREWRVVAYKQGEGYWPITANALTAVILGARAEPSLCETVRKLCIARNPPIDLFQARPGSNTYELQICPLS